MVTAQEMLLYWSFDPFLPKIVTARWLHVKRFWWLAWIVGLLPAPMSKFELIDLTSSYWIHILLKFQAPQHDILITAGDSFQQSEKSKYSLRLFSAQGLT